MTLPLVVARYVDALNRHDADAVAACVSDTFANRHASALGRPTTGRVAYRAALDGFFAEVPGVRYEIVAVTGFAPAGDVGVEDAGVGDADLASRTGAVAYRLTADGGIDVEGVWWLVLDGERIASRMDYWDSATVLGQRGS